MRFSTKVRREEAERLGINISRVLRKALEDEVGRRRREEISDILDKIDIDRIVKNIREDRENID